MPDFLLVLFLFNLSLFLLHEMDAIRRSEWKLFMVLKDMEDDKAYRYFTWIHLPMYTIILSLLLAHIRPLHFGCWISFSSYIPYYTSFSKNILEMNLKTGSPDH
ncbi:hypothetical protein PWP87_04070 [Paenibacillus amylolyticus]